MSEEVYEDGALAPASLFDLRFLDRERLGDVGGRLIQLMEIMENLGVVVAYEPSPYAVVR